MERDLDAAHGGLDSEGFDGCSGSRVKEAKLRRARAHKEVTLVRSHVDDGSDTKVPKFVSRKIPADIGGSASVLNPLLVLEFSATNADGEGVLDTSGGDLVVRGKCLWSDLPEEIVGQILRALPPAAHCRFRSVSKGWKGLLSSEPDWMYWKRTGTPFSVVTTCGTHEIRAFCHFDGKCLRLPQNRGLHEDICSAFSTERGHIIDWQLVDVDKGIFCCRAIVDEQVRLAVTNPVSGSTKYVYLDDDTTEVADFKLKLLVDSEKKNFKIFYAEQESRSFVVYDSSKNGRWDYLYDFLPDRVDDMFVWKDVTYAYSTKSTEPDVLFALDLKPSFQDRDILWNRITVRLPGGKADRFIVSDRDQVMLVRSYHGKRPYLEVWKLRDTGACHDHGPDFSLSMWENLRVGRKIADIQEVKTHRLVDVCCGRGYMCFIFRAGPVEDTGERVISVMEPDICVKHSFVTGRSSVISCPSSWRTFARVFSWEPDENVAIFDESI